MDGSLVRKSLRAFPAIDPPGVFPRMATRHMRGVGPVVTLATVVLLRRREEATAGMKVVPRVIAHPRLYKEA